MAPTPVSRLCGLMAVRRNSRERHSGARLMTRFKHHMLKEILSSSPPPCETPKAAGDDASGGKFYQLSMEEMPDWKSESHRDCGLWYQPACGDRRQVHDRIPCWRSGGCGLCQRISIVACGGLSRDPDHRHHPIRRDRRHISGFAQSQELRLQGDHHQQCRRFLDDERGRFSDSYQAGPELAVPSTKAFTAQLTALFLFALFLAERRGRIGSDAARESRAELDALPQKLQAALSLDTQCETLARRYARCTDFIFAARGVHCAVAMDGALKLKEVSYLHAEAFPSGEILHGPLATIDENMTVFALAAVDPADSDSRRATKKTLFEPQGT